MATARSISRDWITRDWITRDWITRKWLLPCIAALLFAASPIQARDGTKADLAGMTRTFIEDHKTTGARRDARKMAELRRVLSARFYRSLRVVFEKDRRFQARHPGVKPGHAEFTFQCADGTDDGVEVVSTRFHSATAASVVVAFDDIHNGRTYRWKDRYRWVRERGVWRLDDIECEFENPQRRTSLRRGLGH